MRTCTRARLRISTSCPGGAYGAMNESLSIGPATCEAEPGRVLGRCHSIGHGVCPISGWCWIPVSGASEVDGAVGELGVAEVDVAANVSLVVVSRRLGHFSIVLTADTCSYLFQGVDRRAAEAAAALVRRQVPYQSGQNGLQERKNLAVYHHKSAGRHEETQWAPSGSNRRPAD
jgi:hypothetical protein